MLLERDHHLLEETVEHYHRHGYALPGQQLFESHDLEALTNTFNRLQDLWVSRGGRPEHMDVPHFYFPELHRWLMHPRVLDVVEQIIGPDIALFSSHFICKPAGNGKRVPWHEDSAYWKTIFEAGQGEEGDGMEVVTLWLALDPSSLENGCMKVIPDSHRDGYSEYDTIEDEGAVFEGNIKKGSFDEDRAVDCVLEKGEYSLHHAKAIHGSEANSSKFRRCGYTMRYISTKSRFFPERTWGKHHQLYLARGRDWAGNAYGDPTQLNEAWVEAHGAFIPKGH